MAHITSQSGRRFSAIAGLRGILDDWRQGLERHRLFERTYSELSALSDRELADIGITRSQIIDLSRDMARRA